MAPRTFRAPGRVNLIGEHTDYNDGFVMPAAINFSTWLTLFPLSENRIEIYSENFQEEVVFDFDNPQTARAKHWSDYAIGVIVMLLQDGCKLRGARLVIRGEVPLGAGLSSSAALEVVTAYALAAHSELNIENHELAKLCQKAEIEFVGARVGIMDQFVSLFGEANKALLLDCRSLEYKLLPLPTDANLVVCNTMVKHELAASAYNERRQQCEEGVRVLSGLLPTVKALRDVTPDQLETHRERLEEDVYRRCRHIVTENVRVLAAAEALEQGDLGRFGELMYESHRSLRDDFEVSCLELDCLVEQARCVEGVFGARMTGGGFGGCTVNLVARDSVEGFKHLVGDGYKKATGIVPEFYICEAVNGAEEVSNEEEQGGD
ncbi:MAG: galactokinase [Acidobacteria bacterium]|nr:MAG: galactokinase [Acidobacteriota bacterium]